MRLEEQAYAKINLMLDVVGKRADGYHDLVSVMQTVSLHDTLTFEKTPRNGIEFWGNCDLPNDDRNLIVRAVKAYFAAVQSSFGVHVCLEKRIPMQAGLGGGSADAAATLRALNRLNGNALTLSALCEIGATIGADVPFCVMGGTALCEGIGEKLTPVTRTFDPFAVLTMPDKGISTPAAFRDLDAAHGDFSRVAAQARARASTLLNGLAENDPATVVQNVYNRFEEVVLPVRKNVAACKARLQEDGAICACMSGSGPAVFGLFESEQDARDALLRSACEGCVCRFV